MKQTYLYILVEIRPDGTEHEMYLGTKLKDGTRTTYTVNGDLAFQYQKKWTAMHPENRYEMRMECV